MSDTHKLAQVILDNAVDMPRQMALVPDVFEFSYDAALEVQKVLGHSADLIIMMEEVAAYIERSSLSPEVAEQVTALIHDEVEVIGFSQSARSSVIRF